MEHRRAERWVWLAGQADALKKSMRARLGSAEAEDVAHEAILRAVSAVQPPDGEGSKPWLYGIARNVAIDRWRRSRRLVALPLADHISVDLGSSAGQLDLVRALRRLSTPDRRVLTQIATGLKYQEIAAAECVSVGAVRQRVARARARLLAAMKEA